jgi:hypothetical protein
VGFTWRALNDAAPTAAERLGNLEDWEFLPRAWRDGVAGILGLRGREVAMRLDWFTGRGLAAADLVRARTITELGGDLAPSDHAPILLELGGPFAEWAGGRGLE